MKKNLAPALFLSLLVTMVIGCGGGGGTSSSTSASANSGSNSTASGTTSSAGQVGTFLEYSPSAATLAAKRVNSSLKFDATGSQVAATDDCGRPLTNTTVYEQAHTVTFAASGVSEKEQQEAAEFAEAGVLALRQKFPTLVSSTTGISENKKVYVCVQPQMVTGGALAAASSLGGSAFRGIVMAASASSFFNATRTRSAITDTGMSFQAFYQGSATHEMTHLVEQLTLGPYNDTWFTEGLAEYVAFGQSTLAKNTLLTRLAAQNPVSLAWPGFANDGRPKLNDYSVAAATIAYLMSPNGANNSLSNVVALFDRIKTDSASLVATCRLVPTPAGCDSASYSAKFSAFFVTGFEASFKEKDGTPMKLRSGPNNLQDTLAARLTAFW